MKIILFEKFEAMIKDITKFLEVIREIFAILDCTDKRKAVVVLADILMCAILETLGVGIIIPFFTALSKPEKIMEYPFVGYITGVMGGSMIQLIMAMSFFIVIFYVLKNAFLMWSAYFQNTFRFKLQKKLSVKMLNAYMAKQYQFFVDNNSSVVIRGIGGDVGCVKDALGTLFDLITQVLTLLMIAFFLACTDFMMSIGLLGISLICMYLLVVVLRKRTSALGRDQRLADETVTKYTFEILEGIKEILALRKEDKFVSTYEDAFSKKGKIEAKYITVMTFPNRIIETVFMSGIILILYVRLLQGMDLSDFIPQLAVFAVGGIKMLPAMSTVSRSATQIIFQKPGVDEAYANITSLPAEIRTRRPDEEPISEFESMKLDDIHWRYNNMNSDVLNGVSLDIKKGESIAFIGASGSGKTTLVDVILGLFKPQKGQISVNGIDINKCSNSWSKMLSYVQQSIFLTDDSLRNNIAFGLDEADIDDDKVWKALEQAQLSDYVKGLDDGLDTIVGERGVKFSGGQRQRVAIARALYFGTQVIIFDEATAALDNETEKALMESIDALHGEKTLIIVAHRLSTVKNCDRVYEVKEGMLVERDKGSLIQ